MTERDGSGWSVRYYPASLVARATVFFLKLVREREGGAAEGGREGETGKGRKNGREGENGGRGWRDGGEGGA